MRYSLLITSLAAVAAASPFVTPELVQPSDEEIERRQLGTTSNEFSQDGCRANIFIFSRGTTEIGNMGIIVGPPTSSGLKRALGDNAVATEGVDYPGLLSTNLLPGGADPVGIRRMKGLIEKAATDCPTSNILVSGYSQGAAMVHRSVEDLDPQVMARIAGVVMFGDTKNLQERGRIANFPPEKTKIICNFGDAVCAGTLAILPPHIDYARRAPEAVDFFVERVRVAGAAAGGAGNAAGNAAGNTAGKAAGNAAGGNAGGNTSGGLFRGLFGN